MDLRAQVDGETATFGDLGKLQQARRAARPMRALPFSRGKGA